MMHLRRKSWRLLLFIGASFVTGGWAGNSHAQAPASGKGRGGPAFTSTCAGCHGADGHGGEHAPNIASSSAVRQLSDSELLRIVTKGIPGTGMPGFGYLGQETVDSIVGYLRELQGAGTTAVLPGDPVRGQALFSGKSGCSACHMVHGKGGFLASDLTLFGAGQKPEVVHSLLAEPDETLPKNSGWTRIVTKDGGSFEGVLRAEDNFYLSLQSANGSFHFVRQADISERHNGTHAGALSGHTSVLSRTEVDDLVSFLIQSGNLEAAHLQSEPKSRQKD